MYVVTGAKSKKEAYGQDVDSWPVQMMNKWEQCALMKRNDPRAAHVI